jgi:hypothetical protein
VRAVPTAEPAPTASAESAPAAVPDPEPTPSVPPSVPSSAVGSDDAVALASLPKGQGFLFVASPLATNVYVYGLLAGVTNERIMTKCGPRFLRLGTKPGAWQTEGVVEIVKCGASTRVEMAP